MKMVRRLGREDWIAAGIAALERGGAAALTVEGVARALGVSKGSFYWHFRNRAAWRDGILGWWEHCAYAALVLPRQGAPAGATGGLERALRAWAAEDAVVAACLHRLGAERRRGAPRTLPPAARAPAPAKTRDAA